MATTAYTETSASGVTGTIDKSGSWTINGSNRSFSLSHTPDTGSAIGFINGLMIASTISGSTLTFADAPYAGDTVTVVYAVTSSVTASSGAVSAATIIQDAMRYINKLGAGQTISTADQTFGLSVLNDIIDLWRTKSHFVVYYDHSSYAYSTSKQSYSIGQDSADFTADRPIKIIRANLILTADDPDSRVALEVFNMDEYAQLRLPAQSADQAVCLYYQPTYPNGTLYPWPYPTDDSDVLANKLELFTWMQLSSYANTSTAVDLAPGYKNALTKTLSEWLCVPYGIPLNPEVKDQARIARSAIANVNTWSRKLERDYGIPDSEDYC